LRLLLWLAGLLLLVAAALVFVYHPDSDQQRYWFGERSHPRNVP